jgi:PAS domain S-box-containing protein
MLVSFPSAGSARSGGRRAVRRRWPFLLLLSLLHAPIFQGMCAEESSPVSESQSLSPVLLEILRQPGLWVMAGVIVVAGTIAMICFRGVKKWRQKKGRMPKKSSASATGDPGNRYRSLFENANDFFLGAALDGQLLYANTAWQETLDFTESDIASLSIFQIIHSESAEAFKNHFRRAAAGLKIKNIETTLISKYGKRVVVEGSLHCELVNDEPVSIQCIFRDITERKRSASALKQSEERFSRVFAASPIAIAISTLDEGKLQDVNDSFLRMLGYQRHDVVGNTDVDLGLWVNTPERDKIIERVINRETVRDAQCKLRSKRGEVREALISAELIEINMERRLLLMIHDNTERMNLEGQLRQAQKMEGIGQLPQVWRTISITC